MFFIHDFGSGLNGVVPEQLCGQPFGMCATERPEKSTNEASKHIEIGSVFVDAAELFVV